MKRDKCPAFDKTCKSCGGHFEKSRTCEDKVVMVDNVLVQRERTDKSQVGVKEVGVVEPLAYYQPIRDILLTKQLCVYQNG